MFVRVQVHWCVVKMSGDGDCLFHALAYGDGCSGQALRVEVANFLEARADDGGGFREEMQREAAKLRAGTCGGHTAIIAYSHMKQTRVVVRTRRVGEGAPTVAVEEMSHASVRGKEDVCVSHILYNGDGHYDALVAVGVEPDRPQPDLAVYVMAAEVQPRSPSKNSTRRAVKKHTAIKKGKIFMKHSKPRGQPLTAVAEYELPRAINSDTETLPSTQSQSVGDRDDKQGLMKAPEYIPLASISEHLHRNSQSLIKDRLKNIFVRVCSEISV